MSRKRSKPEPVQFVKCPECGEEQPDMGNNVACEVCGYGPMPRASEAPRESR